MFDNIKDYYMKMKLICLIWQTILNWNWRVLALETSTLSSKNCYGYYHAGTKEC